METKLFNAIIAIALFIVVTYASATTTVVVYKNPTCACCEKWADHMHDNGFTVKIKDIGNTEIRKKMGISTTVGSCHTALINGYTFEGHVPAKDIKRFLRERPNAVGLAAPGMPHGSPGMEGKRSDPYNVLLIKKPGDTRKDTIVYSHHDSHTPKKSQAQYQPTNQKQGESVMRLQ